MKRRNWLPWITTFGLFTLSFTAAAQQQTTYRLTHICTTVPFDPIGGCGVADINNKGELVGSRPLNGVPQVAGRNEPSCRYRSADHGDALAAPGQTG
jgi:hypothetical protein